MDHHYFHFINLADTFIQSNVENSSADNQGPEVNNPNNISVVRAQERSGIISAIITIS